MDPGLRRNDNSFFVVFVPSWLIEIYWLIGI